MPGACGATPCEEQTRTKKQQQMETLQTEWRSQLKCAAFMGVFLLDAMSYFCRAMLKSSSAIESASRSDLWASPIRRAAIAAGTWHFNMLVGARALFPA